MLHSTLVFLLHRSACMCSMCILPDLQASCLRARSLALFLLLPLHTTCILHVIACPTCVDYTSQLQPTYMKRHLQADQLEGMSQMSTSMRSVDMRSTLRRDASNAGAQAERQTLLRGQSSAAQLAAAAAGSPLQRGRSDAAKRAEAFARELQRGRSTAADAHFVDETTLVAVASGTAAAGQQEPAAAAAGDRGGSGESPTSQDGISRPQRGLTARRSFSRGAIDQAEALAQTLQRGRNNAAALAGEEPAAPPGLQQGQHSAAEAAARSSMGRLALDGRAAHSGAPLQRGRSSVAEAEAFLATLKLQRDKSSAGGLAAETFGGIAHA